MKRKTVLTIILILFLANTFLITFGRLRANGELVLEDVKEWYWIDDTYIVSVATGDVDADGDTEIVTGGYYADGTRNRAQLCVWDGSTLALEGVQAWHWTSDTGIESVAVGDVDGDGDVEIVTGGWYNDNIRYRAQLCVWDGSTLALEGVQAWHWTSDTVILSVAVGDVDGDDDVEIVTGGYYNDNTYDRAQLCVWDGSTLALEGVQAWHWTGDTNIKSVAIGNVDGGDDTEIVTGGRYYDSHYKAQLCVWNGATLALKDVEVWYWTSTTEIWSVIVDDFDISAGMEIVTAGWYSDGIRANAQVCVWQGHTLTLDYPAQHWYTGGHTKAYSAAIGDWDGDFLREVITGGSHLDPGYGYCAEIWIGEFFESGGFKGWGGDAQESWIDSTYIVSVATHGNKIITGGAYYDGSRYIAQLAVWTES